MRGSADDFPRVVAMLAAMDPANGSSRIARMLWATRWKVGELFESLYLTDDEWVAEIANRTVHGVVHVGLVPHDSGSSTRR